MIFPSSMAVEASPITLLPPSNRDVNRIMSFHGSGRLDDCLSEKVLPVCGSVKTDSFPPTDFKAVSGVTSGRKRLRDSVPFFNPSFYVSNVVTDGYRFGEFTFLGEDFSKQICQQESEIDSLIAYHTENVRAEIEEIQRQNSRRLISSVHEEVMSRLKSKEDEIVKIGQVNWWLEEKVKSLMVENQIWKELVQTHEATANALRNKLEQVLSQIQSQQQLDFGNKVSVIDDAQSYCGSNYNGGGERKGKGNDYKNDDGVTGGDRWWCRKCGKEESSVLLLPCRHLCVCTLCVSSVSLCPVCSSAKSAGVLVNMTSS